MHRLRTVFALLAATAISVLVGCGKDSAQEAKTPPAPVVRDVTVGPASTSEMDETAEVMGTVRSRTITTLSSKIVGKIIALHVREGTQVRAGQLLIELDDQDIAAQVRRAEAGLREAESALPELERAIAAARAAQAAADAQRELAASTLARYQRLLERKSVAPLEFDQVQARHKAAAAEVERAVAEGEALQARRQQIQARIESARAELAIIQVMQGYGKIVSPIAGVVAAKHADLGALAAPGTPLLTLEDGRRYWLEVALPESRVAGLRRGQSLRVQVEGAGIAATAAVSEILPTADPTTRTTTLRLDLPESSGLRSGLFGRAWVPAGRRQAIRVPREAVVERGQLQGMYVVGQDNVARFRLVRTGEVRDNSVEILSGLASGEQIILAGADRVTDGARIEPGQR